MSREQKHIVTDKRFEAIHNDPRFTQPRKKDVKVTIDQRFKGVLEDKDFLDQRKEIAVKVAS